MPVALFLLAGIPAYTQTVKPSEITSAVPATFVDVTGKLGIQFQQVASHTSKKYLLETMGSGVAVFDYDNDGRLDIFVVNGAHLSDPALKGAIPQKAGPKTGTVFTTRGRTGPLKT